MDPLAGLEARFRSMWAYLWAVVLTMIRAEMTRQLGRIILGGKVIPQAIQPSATAGDVLTTVSTAGVLSAQWATGGGGSEGTDPSFISNLAGSITMVNANQYYAGPQIAFPAGTFLITAVATISNPGGAAADVTLKLWTGTAVAKMARQTVPAGGYASVTFDALVTIASATTYTLAADGAAAGMVLIATLTDADTGLVRPATALTAITEEHT